MKAKYVQTVTSILILMYTISVTGVAKPSRKFLIYVKSRVNVQNFIKFIKDLCWVTERA